MISVPPPRRPPPVSTASSFFARSTPSPTPSDLHAYSLPLFVQCVCLRHFLLSFIFEIYYVWVVTDMWYIISITPAHLVIYIEIGTNRKTRYTLLLTRPAASTANTFYTGLDYMMRLWHNRKSIQTYWLKTEQMLLFSI